MHTSTNTRFFGATFFAADCEERLVLIRPLREEARLPKLAAIPLEGLKAPALAYGSSGATWNRPF